MTEKQFNSLKGGDVILWDNNSRGVVVDSRAHHHKNHRDVIVIQFIGGGVLETINRYTGTGISWETAKLVKTTPQPEYQTIQRLGTMTKPEAVTLPAEFVYEPGNGTRFDIAMANLENGMLLVAIPNFKAAYWFQTQVSPGYVCEKLRLLPGDANHIADLINAQLGCHSNFAATPRGWDQISADQSDADMAKALDSDR